MNDYTTRGVCCRFCDGPWDGDRFRHNSACRLFTGISPSTACMLAAYDRIRTAMDLPADCAPEDVARAVEETLSTMHKVAGVEDYPAGMPEVRTS